MPEPQQPPSVGRALGALSVLVTVVAAPIVTAVFAPGGFPQKLTLALAVFAGAFLAGTFVLHRLVDKVDGTRPGRMPSARQAGTFPDPGPNDPVFYVAWDDRGKGCTDTRPHTRHVWYWRADMPYTVGGAFGGAPVYHTAPVHGAIPCGGVPGDEP